MEKGKVVWFNEQKGYGFIRPEGGRDDGKDDVFVHFTGINSEAKRKNLNQLQRVQFERVKAEKGPMATEVTVIDD